MDLELRDRVVVLTGATDGLGAELATALVSEGARVVGCGRNEGRVAAAAEHLDNSESILAADVTVPAYRTDGDPRR
jgi:3-oxoacyl-[acyl-carrier protein] reductase